MKELKIDFERIAKDCVTFKKVKKGADGTLDRNISASMNIAGQTALINEAKNSVSAVRSSMTIIEDNIKNALFSVITNNLKRDIQLYLVAAAEDGKDAKMLDDMSASGIVSSFNKYAKNEIEETERAAVAVLADKLNESGYLQDVFASNVELDENGDMVIVSWSAVKLEDAAPVRVELRDGRNMYAYKFDLLGASLNDFIAWLKVGSDMNKVYSKLLADEKANVARAARENEKAINEQNANAVNEIGTLMAEYPTASAARQMEILARVQELTVK